MPAKSRRRATRAHLSIGEVLSLLQDEFPDITISKIRFLESQGLLDPERTPSGYRKFYEPDIERLRWILVQQKENFLPLKVIKDRLAAGELDGLADGATAGSVAADEGTRSGSPAAAEAAEAPSAPPAAEPSAATVEQPTPTTDSGPVTASSAEDGRGPTRPGFSLDGGLSSATFSFDELVTASGLEARQLTQLEDFGLLAPGRFGDVDFYDEDALAVCRLCGALWDAGIDPRNLRMYLVSAQREAGVYEQLLLPLLKQRRAESRQEATERLGQVVDLGAELHATLLRRLLRDAFLPR